MIKVFHVISHFDVGGAERVAVNISRSDNPAIEYHVVELIRAHSDFTKVFVRELEEAGIRYHRFCVPDIRFHYLFERLAACLFPLWFFFVFLRQRPTVIHSHTEMPDLAVYLFFRLFPFLLRRCRVVRTIHNTRLWQGLEKTGKRVEAFMVREHANVAISKSVQENYARVYGECPPIVYNGISPVSQQVYPGLVAGKTNILFAGRFEEQKGISTLIRIIHALEDNPQYYFHVFGEGSLRPDLELALGNSPNASVRPPLVGVAQYMRAFDYMLMPSEFEGLSIVSIEASVNGLPVIINDCPGLRDTLPSDWELKVSGNALPMYMSLFNQVLPSVDKERLRSYAQAFVIRNFGIRQMWNGYEALYA